MAITTRDQLISAMRSRQDVHWARAASTNTNAFQGTVVFGNNGVPGAGVFAGTSSTAGVVPDHTTAGFPSINAFGIGNTGYIDRIGYSSSNVSRLFLFDLLFKAGTYTSTASTTLASQPSFAARVPSTNYSGLQIWVEGVTTMATPGTITIGYTNAVGTSGRVATLTPGVTLANVRMFRIPLQAGDKGVQRIDSVSANGSGGGAFNVIVLRQLWTAKMKSQNDGDVYGPDRTGMPIVFETSALYPVLVCDTTTVGLPELQIGIING